MNVDKKMLQAMMSMLGKSSGKGNGFMQGLMKEMAKGGNGTDEQDVSWKGLLQQAYGKTHKENVTKETFAYTTNSNDNGGFESQLSCEQFSKVYTGKGSSKKEAEAKAAERAVKAEFPSFAPKSKQKGKSVAEKKANAQQTKVAPMRVHLSEAFSRVHGACTQESLQYEVEEAGGNRFSATLTSPQFSDSYSGEGMGKKNACEAAALAAMQAEFPDEYKSIHGPKGLKSIRKALKAQGHDAQAAKEHSNNPKSRLSSGLCLLAPGNVTKETVVYNIAEVNDKTACTLVISCLPKTRTFKGEAEGTGKERKKEAEFQAAEKALAAIATQLRPLEASQAAKKEAKREEGRAWVENKKAEEKAAKEAKAAGIPAKVEPKKRKPVVKAEPVAKKQKKAW